MKISAHKTPRYVRRVLADEIHTLCLHMQLAVRHAGFPSTEGKSGILRRNITFMFYKYTERNPDRN